jgi:hypothetical protein
MRSRTAFGLPLRARVKERDGRGPKVLRSAAWSVRAPEAALRGSGLTGERVGEQRRQAQTGAKFRKGSLWRTLA